MSESFLTAVFLSLSGGLQDAYTYVYRGKVFANAQTGNIVLLSQNICERNWPTALHYLVPLLSFVLGVAIAEWIRQSFQTWQAIHWRQIVLFSEILLLFAVGFLPEDLNMLANAVVSFSCAMQVQAFRKMTGYAFSSTMCIGNMRSGMEALFTYMRTHNRETLKKSLCYWKIIFLFGLGAGLGGHFVSVFGGKTIWFSCGLLLVGFFLMFIKEEIAEHEEVQQLQNAEQTIV
ncbi:MAG: YoaK family protein [Acutalibacter sp.]